MACAYLHTHKFSFQCRLCSTKLKVIKGKRKATPGGIWNSFMVLFCPVSHFLELIITASPSYKIKAALLLEKKEKAPTCFQRHLLNMLLQQLPG